MTAFIADFMACNLVLQKLIKIKEHIPTPSQPINKKIKLSEDTSKFIKNVKSDKKLRKLGKNGSFFIYSVEYKCTTNDKVLTTTNNETVKESKIKEKLKYAVKEKKNLKKEKLSTIPSRLKINDIKEKIIPIELDITASLEVPFLPNKEEKTNKDKNVIKGIKITSKLMC